MMSNGPCSARRSVHSGVRRISAASTSSGDRSTCTRRKPSRCSPFSDLCSCERCCAHDVRAEVAVGTRPVALLADRLGHVEHDRDREQVVLLGQLDQRPARLALHVGRVDHREPRLSQPRAGDELQHRERVRRSRPGRSRRRRPGRGRSPRRSPRSAEVLARERALARPGRRRSARPGSDPEDRSSSAEHRHLRRRADLGVLGADRQVPDRVAVSLGDAGRPRPRTRSRVHSKRWSGWRNSPAGSVSQRTLYSALGVVTTTVPGRAEPNTFCSSAPPAAAGRGARSPRPAPPRRTRPAACRGRSAGSATARSAAAGRRACSSSLSRRAACSSARTETSTPTISS